MTHDSASGVMKLEDDRVRIEWPGAEREEIHKEVQKTLIEVTQALGGEFHDRKVIPRYGHIDCIFGKNAARDVFPYIAEHLDKTA